MTLDERRLAARIRSGDPAGFDALYERYAGQVLGFALRLTGSRKAQGLSWEMRGVGAVKLIKPAGAGSGAKVVAEGGSTTVTPEMRNLLPPAFLPPDDGEMTVPEFVITLHGQTTRVKGYGAHPITDDRGKVLLFLETKPPLPETSRPE